LIFFTAISKRFLLCVDLGKYKRHEELVNAVDPLVNCVSMFTHVKLIIAHSSGEGFGAHYPAILERLEILDSKCITAEDFSHEEAEAFVNIYGLSKIPMNVVIEQTNRNPLLMQYFRWPNLSIGNVVFLSHLETALRTKVEKLPASTLILTAV